MCHEQTVLDNHLFYVAHAHMAINHRIFTERGCFEALIKYFD